MSNSKWQIRINREVIGEVNASGAAAILDAIKGQQPYVTGKISLSYADMEIFDLTVTDDSTWLRARVSEIIQGHDQEKASKDLADLGLKPSDFTQDLVAAAKEFERALNAFPNYFEVDVRRIDVSTLAERKALFNVRIFSANPTQIYP